MAKKSPQESERLCLKEVNEILKKHDCEMNVRFSQQVVMGESVLRYLIAFEHIPPKPQVSGKEAAKK